MPLGMHSEKSWRKVLITQREYHPDKVVDLQTITKIVTHFVIFSYQVCNWNYNYNSVIDYVIGSKPVCGDLTDLGLSVYQGNGNF